MSLILKKTEEETWRQCALRYASEYGLDFEVEASMDKFLSQDASEQEAAYNACYEWDLLDYEP